MKKIVDYWIVCDMDKDVLAETITTNFKFGWQPIGGVCVGDKYKNAYFFQALVKYEEETPACVVTIPNQHGELIDVTLTAKDA